MYCTSKRILPFVRTDVDFLYKKRYHELTWSEHIIDLYMFRQKTNEKEVE